MKRNTKPLTKREANRIRAERSEKNTPIQTLAKKFHRSIRTVNEILAEKTPAANGGKPMTANQRKILAANAALMKSAPTLQEMVAGFVKQVRDTHPEVGEINVSLKVIREERLNFK